MGFPEPLRVEGLRELRAALRVIDSGNGPAMRKALNQASTVITDKTPPWMPTKTGRARRSVRATSSQTSAKVTEGGARAAYVPWLDFGGRRPLDQRGRLVRRHGRFIYTTYGKHQDEITDNLNDALVELARNAGFQVSTRG